MEEETQVAEKPEAEEQAPPAGKPAPQQDGGKMQSVMQRLVMAAMKLIYSSPESARGIVSMVQKVGDPVQGLAQATNLVLNQIKGQIKGMDPNMVLVIAPVVMAMIAELAVKASVIPQDPKILSAALEALKSQLGGAQQAPAEQPAPAEAEEPEKEPAAPQGLIAQRMGG